MQKEQTRNVGAQASEATQGDISGQGEGEGGAEGALSQIDTAQVLDTVSSFARENPHTALAIAAGIGFILGGGLTPRLLGTIGMFAARQYMRDAVNVALQGAVSEQPEQRTG